MQIYSELKERKKTISVVGLGYVGLPLALEMAKYYEVIGFDINPKRIEQMQSQIDPSAQMKAEDFQDKSITFTSRPEDLSNAHFHIVAVPTDIDEHKVPNLNPLRSASEIVGNSLKQGDYVVFESTVFPGCTEEICLPVLEEKSGLSLNTDFKLGYSPERINPGSQSKTVDQILKIVSGSDDEALQEISKVYGDVIHAGLYQAGSIKVAEAAKVIENTQRDINISLMNELAIIFDQLQIDTEEVIEAAATKWNFHKYKPGLVGGHCISVDPFYLIYKAKQVGYDPEVIAAGRRVNDYIPSFIAKKVVQTIIELKKNPRQSKVLVLGVTYKENVPDIRNSKVFDLIKELRDFSIQVDVSDPYASRDEVRERHDVDILYPIPTEKYDGIIIAVGHDEYLNLDRSNLKALSKDEIILFDIKGILSSDIADNYWKL